MSGKMQSLMAAAGAMVAKRSAERAPFLHGNLEAAHEARFTRRNRDQITVEVSVGGSTGGVNVDDYVLEMHEGEYNLGPNSQIKQAANPRVRIGRKFLERAVEASEDEIVESIEKFLLGEIT
jgi:hypothetical protein